MSSSPDYNDDVEDTKHMINNHTDGILDVFLSRFRGFPSK